MKEKIKHSLFGFGTDVPLATSAEALLNVLEYESTRKLRNRSMPAYDFLKKFRMIESDGDDSAEQTLIQRQLIDTWRNVHVIFQFTEQEINRSREELFSREIDRSRIKSFLFVAVDLKEGGYSRTQLADFTRAVNRPSNIPVIVMYRYGVKYEIEGRRTEEKVLTIAAAHRRVHKRDELKDVITKVSLIKDIRVNCPHRMHVDTLSDLALTKLVPRNSKRKVKVVTFDDFYSAWERVLDIELLNQRFYDELYRWFVDCSRTCRITVDSNGEESNRWNVIRLISRILFVWFLKEKGLAPEAVFDEESAKELVKNHDPDSSNYYFGILQNLFFATLNTPIDERAWKHNVDASLSDSTIFQHQDMLRDPKDLMRLFNDVPFVNGGLFDSLEQEVSHPASGLNVPSRVFFDEEDGLFPILYRHKFTVEENTPLNQEVALDPELLGRVFENLLAACNIETKESVRKLTGSFYTPRPVVEYMVHESLTEVILNKLSNSARIENEDRKAVSTLLDHGRAFDNERFKLDETKRMAIVKAIAELKMLDPAVGSGAFAMGILQTLTLALRRIDPSNRLWELFQRQGVGTSSVETSGSDNCNRRDVRLTEIETVFEKYRTGDYGRKLFLIQNCIHGVDIQTIACQIAKLRFFISLVIEQEVDRRQPNLGIQPLPNLETNFVAADFLLNLPKTSVKEVWEMSTNDLVERLIQHRKNYFHAHTRSQKMKLQKEDSELRNDLSAVMQMEESRSSFGEELLKWNPYDQNACTGWFDPKCMFDVGNGFDLIIGNPPYRRLSADAGLLRKKYQSKGVEYKTFCSIGDIYQLFLERGCLLLKEKSGVLAYITSNTWLRAVHGKASRSWLGENHSPLRLIEMGKQVFATAIVDAAILIIKEGKERSQFTCPAVDMDHVGGNKFPPPAAEWVTLKPHGDFPWIALSEIERSILTKINKVGTPLKEWDDVNIKGGIATGCNDAFIVGQKKRDELISADRKSEELLKPIIRGRDIQRYRANWANRWIITTFPSLHIDIDEYPAIRNHLWSVLKNGLPRSKVNWPDATLSGSNLPKGWFELQSNCPYRDEFAREKVIWLELVEKARFALDETGKYISNTALMLTCSNPKAMCAILNSTVPHWYIQTVAPTSGMGTSRWIKSYVKDIPLPNEPSTLVELARVMNRINSSRSLVDVREVDNMIDTCLFETIKLRPDEIRYIREATA